MENAYLTRLRKLSGSPASHLINSSAYVEHSYLFQSHQMINSWPILLKTKIFTDCYSANCTGCYTGTWHRTRNGHECQRWDSQRPHKHKMNEKKMFQQEDSMTKAQNYCRDPTDSGGCFVTNENIIFCKINVTMYHRTIGYWLLLKWIK